MIQRIVHLPGANAPGRIVEIVPSPRLFQHWQSAIPLADSSYIPSRARHRRRRVASIGRPVDHIGEIWRESIAVESQARPTDLKTILRVIVPIRFFMTAECRALPD